MKTIRVGMVGDYQVGKSTLINCLLKKNTTSIGDGTPTTHSPIVYCYGANENVSYTTKNMLKRTVAGIDQLKQLDTSETAIEITVRINAEILKNYTLIDLPGFGGTDKRDDFLAENTLSSLDFAIVFSNNIKAIGGEQSHLYQDVQLLKRYNIPYYFVLNCVDTSSKKWFPEHPDNYEIMEANLELLSSYPPLSYPLESPDILRVNLLWYWFTLHDNDLSISKYDANLTSYGLRETDKESIYQKSNFEALEKIFSMENKMYFELRRAIKQEINEAMEELCPIGTIQAFAFNEIPNGWLLCDGTPVKKRDYPKLFEKIGYTFGNIDPNTFRLPDLRGRFIRGWDKKCLRDTDKRRFGSYQEDALQDHTHVISAHYTKACDSHTHKVYFDRYSVRDTNAFSSDLEVRSVPSVHAGFEPLGPNPGTSSEGIHAHSIPSIESEKISQTESIHVDSETRPHNVALLYCIKATNERKMEFLSGVISSSSEENNSLPSLLNIVPSFIKVSHFSEGRVRCLDDEGWIFLTPKKEIVNHYEDASDFSEGRAAVKMNGKWGFINYDEQIVIPCIYSRVGDFGEGVAYYEIYQGPCARFTIERGFINYEGQVVLSLTENYAGYGLQFDNKFNYGLFKIYSDVHTEWINHEGKIINKYQGEDSSRDLIRSSVEFGSICNGLAFGKETVCYSYTERKVKYLRFDVNHNTIEEYNGESNSTEHIRPSLGLKLSKQYSFVGSFVSTKWDGSIYERARVKLNDYWGFIDNSGNEVTPCVFSDVQDYSEGYAAVSKDNSWFFIDPFGDPLR